MTLLYFENFSLFPHLLFWFPATTSAQVWMKVVLKPWPELKDSLDIFGIQIEQEIRK